MVGRGRVGHSKKGLDVVTRTVSLVLWKLATLFGISSVRRAARSSRPEGPLTSVIRYQSAASPRTARRIERSGNGVFFLRVSRPACLLACFLLPGCIAAGAKFKAPGRPPEGLSSMLSAYSFCLADVKSDSVTMKCIEGRPADTKASSRRKARNFWHSVESADCSKFRDSDIEGQLARTLVPSCRPGPAPRLENDAGLILEIRCSRNYRYQELNRPEPIVSLSPAEAELCARWRATISQIKER